MATGSEESCSLSKRMSFTSEGSKVNRLVVDPDGYSPRVRKLIGDRSESQLPPKFAVVPDMHTRCSSRLF